MSSIDIVRQGSIYDQAATKELAGTQIGGTFVDLASPGGPFSQAAGPLGTLSQGVEFEMHGDWLYVDPSSVGAAQATLYADADDSRTVSLVPGAVYKETFDRIRIFSCSGIPPTPLAAPAQGQQNLTDPGIRLFYGLGICPFEEKSIFGSTSPIIYGATAGVSAPAQARSTQVNFPSGAVLTVGLNATQTTSLAANTSTLRANLIYGMIDGSTYSIPPDFSDHTDAPGGAVATARLAVKWFPHRVPRMAVTCEVTINNFGTEATNNVLIGGNSFLVG